jgi:hypothetical protein
MTGTTGNGERDYPTIARAIIDANVYLTLGTVDEAGAPWVTPVAFASADYREFYWTSFVEARHSTNLSKRPRISMVIFDSTAPIYTGQAVYMSGVAEELSGAELERGLEVYPPPGANPCTPADLLPPVPYRLYRATASEHWIVDPDAPQGRTSVTP